MLGCVKFREWRPTDESQWPLICAALVRWTTAGKALLYNSEHVPVDVGTLLSGQGVVVLNATLEVYDADLWRVWVAA